jgi:arylsulfatase A-like enzyme
MTLPSMAPVSLLFLLLLANAAAAAAVQAAPAPPRPNLLFMMTDQQRWDTMSAVVPSLATPNMDRIAKEGVLFKWGYTSTPTCTPARAAILTGQKPWNHGSLGAVAVAHSYPFEMPTTLAALGYSTTSIGKDHFGWVSDGGDGDGDGATVHFDGPDASTCLGSSGGVQEQEEEEEEEAFPPPWGPNKGHGVPHGYQQTSLYDGIVAEPDDYHQWFEREMGGKKPETGWPSECDVYHPPPPPSGHQHSWRVSSRTPVAPPAEIDMNSWRGEAYAYANESLHPTAWVGQQAVDFINDRSTFISNASFQHSPWCVVRPTLSLLCRRRRTDRAPPHCYGTRVSAGS